MVWIWWVHSIKERQVEQCQRFIQISEFICLDSRKIPTIYPSRRITHVWGEGKNFPGCPRLQFFFKTFPQLDSQRMTPTVKLTWQWGKCNFEGCIPYWILVLSLSISMLVDPALMGHVPRPSQGIGVSKFHVCCNQGQSPFKGWLVPEECDGKNASNLKEGVSDFETKRQHSSMVVSGSPKRW